MVTSRSMENSLTSQNPPEGRIDEKSWKMMTENRVIFSASGVPNLLEIGSKPIFFFVFFFFGSLMIPYNLRSGVFFFWKEEGLLCNVHCIATVVLRKQLNFKSAVIRSNRSSCLVLSVTRLKLPLGQILNDATCDVYSPKAVETSRTMLRTLFSYFG